MAFTKSNLLNNGASINVVGGRAIPSSQTSQMIYYANLDSSKQLHLYAIDYTSVTLDVMAQKTTTLVGAHECKTIPASGNSETWLPIGYIYDGGIEYISVVVTVNAFGPKCSSNFSAYSVFKVIHSGGPTVTFQAHLGAFVQNIYGYHDPSWPINGSDNLGVGIFQGYTKTVDHIIMKVAGANIRSITLVFYENT